MLGRAFELEKNHHYTSEGWEGEMFRIKSVKVGREQVIVTRHGGDKDILERNQAVRYHMPGRDPENFAGGLF